MFKKEKYRISIYVNSKGIAPSGYYRILQYFKNNEKEIRVHSLFSNSIYRWWHSLKHLARVFYSPYLYTLVFFRTLYFLWTDVCSLHSGFLIVSKFILPHHISVLHLYLLKKIARTNKIVWDFDDNILDGKSCSSREFKFLSHYSSQIIVTSDFLKSQVAEPYRSKVYLLPTTDGDMRGLYSEALLEKRKESFASQLILVWVATSSNLIYLERLVPEIDQAAELLYNSLQKQLVLKVVCNRPLVYTATHLRVENIQWERERAMQEMAYAHVGIMPLFENRFTLGKGGFKLVQYLSVGLPLIASKVGYNKEIVTPQCGYIIDDGSDLGGWSEAILELAKDWNHYLQMSKEAMLRYEHKFSYEQNLKFWNHLCKL